MSLGKLLKTERTLNVYKKTSSMYLGDAVEEINVDIIPLEELIKVVHPNGDDPFLYHAYKLNKEQLNQLSRLSNHPIQPDFKKFKYYLECYGIYDRSTE